MCEKWTAIASLITGVTTENTGLLFLNQVQLCVLTSAGRLPFPSKKSLQYGQNSKHCGHEQINCFEQNCSVPTSKANGASNGHSCVYLQRQQNHVCEVVNLVSVRQRKFCTGQQRSPFLATKRLTDNRQGLVRSSSKCWKTVGHCNWSRKHRT
jgi:hypothetical protein